MGYALNLHNDVKNNLDITLASKVPNKYLSFGSMSCGNYSERGCVSDATFVISPTPLIHSERAASGEFPNLQRHRSGGQGATGGVADSRLAIAQEKTAYFAYTRS
jgi:hypothetical protein